MHKGRAGVYARGGLSKPGTSRIGRSLITSINKNGLRLSTLFSQASRASPTPPISYPIRSPTSMYHRTTSHRQAHTPTPAYNQGYGGYASQPPPPPHHGGGHPGYSQQPPPPPRGPPAGADPELWHWFSAVDTDRSGSITVTELQSALVNGTVFFSPLLTIFSARLIFLSLWVWFRKLDQ